MWAKMMKDLGAKEPKAMMLRFHTQTAGSSLTAQQPMNNISRVTLQALSAVLGGTQSLHTNGFDEAYSLPTEKAAQIALRTQQILMNESGITDPVDPLAGSYYVEALTHELEQEAWKEIRLIEEKGGSVAAIEQGYIQEAIARSAYAYQRSIESHEKIIVGLNRFQSSETAEIPILKVDDQIRNQQIKRLKELRRQRDPARCDQILQELNDKASSGENIMPTVLTAVENYCTLGEISDELRGVFGQFS